MKQKTKNAFNRAYVSLQRIIDELYRESDEAVDNEDYIDASLLEAQAEKLFAQAEDIPVIITEQADG
jgi:hypothetical protein